jgi:hypothetical protein
MARMELCKAIRLSALPRRVLFYPSAKASFETSIAIERRALFRNEHAA